MTSPLLDQVLLVAIIAMSAVAIVSVAGRKFHTPVALIAGAAFIIYFVLGMTIWTQFPNLIAPDARTYHQQAVDISSGAPYHLFAGKEGFALLGSVIYSVAGPAPLAMIALNSVAMGLLVLVLWNTAALLSGRRAATIAALGALGFPPLLLWGGQLLREPMVWLLIACIANVAVRSAMAGLSSRRLLSFLILVAALTTVRAPIAVVLVLSLLGALVALGEEERASRKRQIVALGVAACLLLLASQYYEGLGQLQQFDADRIALSRNALIDSAATGFGVRTDGMEHLAAQLPASTLNVLAGPPPWTLPAVIPDTASWLALLALAALSGTRLRREGAGRAVAVLVVPAAALIFVIALTSGNYGTMIRLRTMPAVLLIPLAASAPVLTRIQFSTTPVVRSGSASIRCHAGDGQPVY